MFAKPKGRRKKNDNPLDCNAGNRRCGRVLDADVHGHDHCVRQRQGRDGPDHRVPADPRPRARVGQTRASRLTVGLLGLLALFGCLLQPQVAPAQAQASKILTLLNNTGSVVSVRVYNVYAETFTYHELTPLQSLVLTYDGQDQASLVTWQWCDSPDGPEAGCDWTGDLDSQTSANPYVVVGPDTYTPGYCAVWTLTSFLPGGSSGVTWSNCTDSSQAADGTIGWNTTTNGTQSSTSGTLQFNITGTIAAVITEQTIFNTVLSGTFTDEDPWNEGTVSPWALGTAAGVYGKILTKAEFLGNHASSISLGGATSSTVLEKYLVGDLRGAAGWNNLTALTASIQGHHAQFQDLYNASGFSEFNSSMVSIGTLSKEYWKINLGVTGLGGTSNSTLDLMGAITGNATWSKVASFIRRCFSYILAVGFIAWGWYESIAAYRDLSQTKQTTGLGTGTIGTLTKASTGVGFWLGRNIVLASIYATTMGLTVIMAGVLVGLGGYWSSPESMLGHHWYSVPAGSGSTIQNPILAGIWALDVFFPVAQGFATIILTFVWKRVMVGVMIITKAVVIAMVS